ncbi:MAG: hypothetical protein E6J11_19220 [Chloroflexi bacterium]|nr:MAG: hypothetical protein E6J11_19220 [Chloroflexota bacterium]
MTLVLKRNRRAAAMRILVTDRIAQEGIDLLRTRLPNAQIDVRLDLTAQQLQAVIGQYTALIVRSETRVTSAILAAATQLKVVGRAGVGLDNIDTEAAKRYGIAVVNSPGGNTIAAAEHTIALLLSLARHIPAATSSTRAGRWEKSHFLGVQVRDKVLGILGLGKVGKEVAQCAQGLGLRPRRRLRTAFAQTWSSSHQLCARRLDRRRGTASRPPRESPGGSRTGCLQPGTDTRRRGVTPTPSRPTRNRHTTPGSLNARGAGPGRHRCCGAARLFLTGQCPSCGLKMRENFNERKTISMVAMKQMDTHVLCPTRPSSFADAGENRMALCYE